MARCDSYTPGQCTAGACALAPWIPDLLGDGGDWADHWRARGGQVVLQAVPGSVVSYCRGDGYSEFGHCAYVERVYPDGTFLVREMNFVAAYEYDERISGMGDVCGFLLPPPGWPGSGGPVPPGGGPGPLDPVLQAWSEIQGWYNSAGEFWVNEFARLIGLFRDGV